LAFEQPLEESEIAAVSVPPTELDASSSKDEDAVQGHQLERPTKTPRDNIEQLSLPKKIAIFLASLGIFIALWQGLAYLAGNSAILAGPVPVAKALSGLLEITPSSYARLGLENAYGALAETFEVVTLGLGLSVAVGVPIGVIMGRWRLAGTLLEPWVSATNSVPIVVLIPSLYFSIGGGFRADVFISFVLSVFTVILNTHSGVSYIGNALAEVGKTFGASEKQFISKIIIPASLPDIVAGIRIAVGRALLGAVMAEALLGGNHGLGGFMITFEDILNTPAMMASVVLIAIVGITLFQVPKILEKRLFRWKENDRISRRTKR
jgi:ABC-type nitrate/sulfonate/bicarbonate transport system permease component